MAIVSKSRAPSIRLSHLSHCPTRSHMHKYWVLPVFSEFVKHNVLILCHKLRNLYYSSRSAWCPTLSDKALAASDIVMH